MRERFPNQEDNSRRRPDLGAPDPRDRWADTEPEEKINKGRRRFIFNAAAAAGVGILHATIGKQHVEIMLPEREGKSDLIAGAIEDYLLERERELIEKIHQVQGNLRDPLVQEARAGNGEHPASLIVQALEHPPILPDDIIGTKLDAGVLARRYPVDVIVEGRHGNGVFFDGQLHTAAHAIYGDDVSQYPVQGIDVSVGFELDKTPGNTRLHTSWPNNLVDDPTLTNADIEGGFVCVVGKDPDATSDAHGRKMYPGVATKITPELVKYLGVGYPDKKANSFMMVLPPGEAKKVDKYNRRASGMSGSPVFLYRDGQYQLCGIFWGVQNFEDETRTVSVGYFHGIDEMRRVSEHVRQAHK